MFSCCSSKKILTQIDGTCTVKNSINTDESFIDVPITPTEIKQEPEKIIQEPVIKVSLLPSTDEEREIQEAKDAIIALELYEAKNGLNMYVSSNSESD